MAAGIITRHARSCRTRGGGGRCNCAPTYQASVFDVRQDKKIRKTFPSKAAARLWRQDALVAVRNGKLAEARPKTTMRAACDAWIVDARKGIVRPRSGDPFKPGTIRAYDQALRLRVYPTLAARSTASVACICRISSTGSSPRAWRPRRSTRPWARWARSMPAPCTATSST